MGSFFALIAQLAVAYWVYYDARKTGLPQMKTMLWTLGTVMIPFPFALLIVAAYFFIGKKGYVAERRDDKTIDVQAEVVSDEKPERIEQQPDNPEKFCRMCGNGMRADETVCSKCHTVSN